MTRELMHWDTFEQDNYTAKGVGWGWCMVEVRASTTLPILTSRALYATVTVRDPPTPFLSEVQKFRTLWILT